ncbi:aromatic amino acid ammonia-lyase [Nocardioides panacis]|uniref:Aromatic amino acid ammonia-lyase n=1 Tax=Nocardioides panacis TaxID=2849501 RepID=A0A975SYS4_9ACTN|nr:aromatic amino acid lyase [Nocardioides panacis]QWZ08366.1 aromatic amino acid ammonia-lyase [Nocardioides panacis]
MTGTVHVREAPDLDAAAVLAVADGARLRLDPDLLAALQVSRDLTVATLTDAGPVYGVTTGMGLQSHLAVGAAEQPAYQGDLMLARAVGTAPWLDRRTTRAVLATRLRTLLDPETGISPALATALVALLDADVLPALPATANGAAGEIIPLAHLGGLLTGSGDALAADGTTLAAADALARAGLAPYTCGTKEGVALLQGVPVATARAVLLAHDARVHAAQALAVAAAEVAVLRAPRDPYVAALARGDEVLAAVHEGLLRLAGDEPGPRMLQAPVSFRVTGPAIAHLLRSARHLEDAVDRSLAAVSTSPALVDGRFLGTAGFDGFDLAACADGVRLAVLHLAETGAARLHRMLDARVTGLAPQLSADPGRQAGLVVVHKRAVGLVHAARRTAAPASLGATETSLGQEDVQSFGLESAQALQDALAVLRDVTACELLAVHQATLLGPDRPRGSATLQLVLRKASEVLPDQITDRHFGRDVRAIAFVLGVGWAHDVLHAPADAAFHPARDTP